jgi:hypothetical protein
MIEEFFSAKILNLDNSSNPKSPLRVSNFMIPTNNPAAAVGNNNVTSSSSIGKRSSLLPSETLDSRS